MLKSKPLIISLILIALIVCIPGVILIIDSFSANVSEEEWQDTPELALKREVAYGEEFMGDAKTEDVLSVKLMLDKLTFEETNTLYAIFLSKTDVFTIARLIKDPTTGKWRYHSTLLYEKDLSNPNYIYNAQDPDRVLAQTTFKDADSGYILGLKFRDGSTVRVHDKTAKMKTYLFAVNDISYSIDFWYITEDLPQDGLCVQYKTN